jgi:hypothetical protein
MSIPTLQLTTAQLMAQDVSNDIVNLKRFVQLSRQSYARFWGRDQAETIAALNADKTGYLSLLSAHHTLYTAANTAAEIADIAERVPTTLPDWVSYTGTEFVLVA